MNLIEQLGGYDQANNKLLKMDKILKEVYYSHSDAQKANELRQTLLEYRRQHNIFEVGDKVVYLSNIAPEHNVIYRIDLVTPSACYIVDDLGMDYYAPHYHIKHATDEEIKAGHRS